MTSNSAQLLGNMSNTQATAASPEVTMPAITTIPAMGPDDVVITLQYITAFPISLDLCHFQKKKSAKISKHHML
jgi:hypothetical protein